ncbi:glycolate oxidase, GlcE subunit [Oceaniovalibus guishaninsula JLT2003]|uniref:Glycolate oxidase, GlcE subunit n=1 Tax=Oceaniovalibus guishaninsula JLT2003 TaxID=1231392 RepID=K2HDX9_9RHOB|nr:FAD-binding protein [Oceaniovalibus guishaninsula]EKE44742.1 glycolate oxidase, GlcE subunit [Oceaniovalibus guishaninsula JLT2003]
MLSPRDEADLAEAIRGANTPLHVRGGGTRGVPAQGEALSVARLSGVTLYEPGALTLVARAGTPLAEIEQALAAENQRLAFEPMDHRPLLGTQGTPTIGGAVAMNASGPRRIQVGALRDALLGVRFVDGTGMIVKNGGRVMKNVTGYDLVKLMAGSRGTLGVLSEVSLKVLPAPAAAATLVLPDEGPDRAVRQMAAALRSPFEVNGAAYLPGQGTLLRVEGFADSVAYRAGRLRDLLDDAADGDGDVWTGIRDAVPLGRDGDAWRISVRPSDGPRVVAAAKADRWFMDWGGGLVWAALPEGTDLRARLAGIDGHATLVRAGFDTHARLGTLHPEAPALRTLSDGLRARFDPRGILNPRAMATV